MKFQHVFVILILLLMAVLVLAGSSDQRPNHSHARLLGTGWECDRGFQSYGSVCIPETPDNTIVDTSDSSLASASSANINDLPATAPCRLAYNKCTSSCSQPVYDHQDGHNVNDTAFAGTCEAACSFGETACAAEAPATQCDTFIRQCQGQCQVNVAGQALTSSEAGVLGRQACAQACQHGFSRCSSG